ncbi:RNA-guided endonuclease InsQ/TnpB family protein [Actinomadura chokoriensis]
MPCGSWGRRVPRGQGFKNFFDFRSGARKGARVGFPTWRKRKHGSRFRYDADRARPAHQRAVYLPGIGKVRTREDMTWLTGRITDGAARVIGATVKETAGRWWVSFQIEIDRAQVNQARRTAEDAPACGIDVGVKTFATIVDDDGTVTELHAPKPLKSALRKLRRANQALSRKADGSANRRKAARRVVKLHLDVAHQRADFLHKTTTTLARTKRAIAVETLNVAGMTRNRRLARAISDLGFGEFYRQLAYKADWYGAQVWAADRWFPSSRLCGDCGTINTALTLADRTWQCACGTVHDRDVNAAHNLLAALQQDQQAA